MRDVIIQEVDKCRYATAGDYFIKDGITYIQVKRQLNDDYTFLISIHELIEQYLTERKGIKEEDILKFDLAHDYCEEPGAHPDSIYKNEHEIAEIIERILAKFMGVDWNKYEQEIQISE